MIPFKKTSKHLTKRSVEPALKHIEELWPQLKRTQKEDTNTLIGLPNPYIVPSLGDEHFHFQEQYYWDSYFTSLGLDDEELVTGMLDNLIYMFERFNLIPNASRFYMTSRSHPPLLTSYIFMVYDKYGKKKDWLKRRLAAAELEYHHVWMGKDHPMWHNVHKGLSRYYDINVLHDLAEAESGWDMTPRFERKCLDYLPIDLNSLLFKYEMDFARGAEINEDYEKAQEWRALAEARRANIDKLMFSKLKGYYFDYDFIKQSRGDTWSLAGFYPMWAGMASREQADRLVGNLNKFLKKGGLVTTAGIFMYPQLFGSLPTQWAFPNGWAPLHAIVIDGLERYGYHEEATKVAMRWLHTNVEWYRKNHHFLEKYNVNNPSKNPVEGVYPSQVGFGWTNGVFVYLSNKYVK
ncbi:MAG: alpha,alpha-trehalase [bacterium]|nr:alpha,alpha-trehalase [bacterium]